jgi:inhibitor of KinA sporulation pathway (predicted exonuclease)
MHYIIFDLEATCWEDKTDKVNEIIEIGAVKLSKDLEIIDTFSQYVRPVNNPELSDFCKLLTSIFQADIDSAKTFKDAIEDFERWILTDGSDVLLLSWGRYDKKQILAESILKNYSGNIIKLLDEKHISLKHEFARIRKERACGMTRALEKLNLPLEGTHHRGIDDAKNITKIFKCVLPDLIEKGIL